MAFYPFLVPFTMILSFILTGYFRGWAQANITGANLDWPEAFNRDVILNGIDYEDTLTTDGKLDPDIIDWQNVWIFGAVNGVTYFAASLM